MYNDDDGRLSRGDLDGKNFFGFAHKKIDFFFLHLIVDRCYWTH